jgi:cytochrome c-type biogenesis protein CcmF
MYSSRDTIILSALDSHIDLKKYDLKEGDIAVGAVLKITDSAGKVYTAEPLYVISGNQVQTIDDTLPKLGLEFSFTKIDPKSHSLSIAVSEAKHVAKDYIVMEAIIFPYINVLWIGCLIMVLGTMLAIRQRILKSREAKAGNSSLNEIKTQ